MTPHHSQKGRTWNTPGQLSLLCLKCLFSYLMKVPKEGLGLGCRDCSSDRHRLLLKVQAVCLRAWRKRDIEHYSLLLSVSGITINSPNFLLFSQHYIVKKHSESNKNCIFFSESGVRSRVETSVIQHLSVEQNQHDIFFSFHHQFVYPEDI